ncbi:hypothetical protein FHW16_000743 [Phyllobacterium myrsinacearum]|uniref:Uncharacterized protein n=1 Tax=Phyllobacterium myrsinacearum TaxID=28101 RepID=A0A839EB11_9HYPH|nr:hypothetical protein [Phyllobacterium myrsinacearum]
MLLWKSPDNGIKSIIQRLVQTKISAGFPMLSPKETRVPANCSGQYRESLPLVVWILYGRLQDKT